MRLNLQQEKIFDLWENEFNIEKNVHITDGLQIHYEHKQKCLPFLLKIENINGILQNGRDLKRMTYFKPMSLGQASLIYDVFAKFEEKIYEFHKIPHNQLLDEGLIWLCGAQRLQKNKITYFRNLIVCFERIEKVHHRNKDKYCLIVRILYGEVLLPKNCYNSDSE